MEIKILVKIGLKYVKYYSFTDYDSMSANINVFIVYKLYFDKLEIKRKQNLEMGKKVI